MKTKRFALACFFTPLLSFTLSALAGVNGRESFTPGIFTPTDNYFTDSVQQESDNPFYHHYLGKNHLKSKGPEDAIAPYDIALQLNPAGINSLCLSKKSVRESHY